MNELTAEWFHQMMIEKAAKRKDLEADLVSKKDLKRGDSLRKIERMHDDMMLNREIDRIMVCGS